MKEILNLFRDAPVRIPTMIAVSKNLYFNPKEECWKQQFLRVKEIQKITKGDGALLCFIDDGVGVNKELTVVSESKTDANIMVGKYKIREPLLSFVPNGNFHGEHSTHGASIVVGNTLGIFPNMELASIQVLDSQTGKGSLSWVINGINEATKLNYGVINLSLGVDGGDFGLKKALTKFCNGKRIAVCASGNDAQQGLGKTDYPAAYANDIDGVLSIAACQIDEEGNVKITAFSSYGVVTLAAPGHSLKAMGLHDEINYVDGTSFAAPIIGSTIAAAQAINPNITFEQIISYLKQTSKEIPETGNDRQGYGCVDIVGFLTKVTNNEPYERLKRIKPASICSKIKEYLS